MSFCDLLKEVKTLAATDAVAAAEKLRSALATAETDMPAIQANGDKIIDAVEALIALT